MAKFKVITSRANQGFFTQLFHTLQHLEDAEREGMKPVIYWSGGIYKSKNGYNGSKTKNVWDFFFEPVSKYSFEKMHPNAKVNKYGDFRKIKDKDIQFVSKFRNKSLPHEPENCWNTRMFPPNFCLVNPSFEQRNYIHGLIKKWAIIRKIVIDKVNELYNKDLRDKNFVSIHMRACNDHLGGQGHNIMDRYLEVAKEYLEANPENKIFVATDSQEALDNLVNVYGDSIVYRKEATHSKNGYPLQYACQSKKKNRPPGPKVFEDALIDCLLLARGQKLYRGFSNVASAATFFNPYIESIYVPKYNTKDKE